MLDVDQNYGEPHTPKPLPTFKDYVAQDVETVFFNLNEFAEERYIDDKQMLCITQHPGVNERAAHWEGGAKQSFDQGMYKADLLLFVKQKDYGPMPKNGKQITLDKKRDYKIKSCCGFPDRSESGKCPPPSATRWLRAPRCGRR